MPDLIAMGESTKKSRAHAVVQPGLEKQVRGSVEHAPPVKPLTTSTNPLVG
jgi:hypothetical protein